MNSAPNPLLQLTLARLRLFFREPSTLFWAFGFPVVLSLALGLAFRNRPPEPVQAGVQEGPGAQETFDRLAATETVKPRLMSAEEARIALRSTRVAIVVIPGKERTYLFDPSRPDSRLARAVVDDALQRAEGRADVTAVADRPFEEKGGRYIDFLVPGLIGMNIMQSGMWGVGYVIVDMRTRKLLKRMLATPMRRSDFLISFVLMRLVFLLIELPLLLLVPWLVFGITVQGSWLAFFLLSLLGAATFAGVGLLVASRAANTQTVGGLMNLVMMPMFICSGVFFSASNFPDAMQPIIRMLPLTALNDGLRSIMNEGAGLSSLGFELGVLGVVGVVTMGLALKLFRWN